MKRHENECTCTTNAMYHHIIYRLPAWLTTVGVRCNQWCSLQYDGPKLIPRSRFVHYRFEMGRTRYSYNNERYHEQVHRNITLSNMGKIWTIGVQVLLAQNARYRISYHEIVMKVEARMDVVDVDHHKQTRLLPILPLRTTPHAPTPTRHHNVVFGVEKME